MMNVSTELEFQVIVDDRLADTLRRWREAEIISDQACEASIAIANSTGTDSREARRAELKSEYLVDLTSSLWGEWQTILKTEYEGATVILDGIAYVSQGEQEDTFDVKVLRPSGKPRVATDKPQNGHLNGVAVSPKCQCKSDDPATASIPDGVTHRELWLLTIRRAIRLWHDAKEWDAESDRVCKLARAGTADTRERYETWGRIEDVSGAEVCRAKDWLTACILTYHGKIGCPDDVNTLRDDWSAVGLEVDGVMYLVRSDSNEPDYTIGQPILEITTSGAVELLTA